MQVERSFVPGEGKDCGDCTKHDAPYCSSRFNCSEVGLMHDGRTPIVMNEKGERLTGERSTCWGFKENFSARIRCGLVEARLALYSIAPFVPPV